MLTELVLAYMDGDALEVQRSETAKRIDAAIIAAAKAGHGPAVMARLTGKDRTTLQHRLGRLTKET